MKLTVTDWAAYIFLFLLQIFTWPLYIYIFLNNSPDSYVVNGSCSLITWMDVLDVIISVSSADWLVDLSLLTADRPWNKASSQLLTEQTGMAEWPGPDNPHSFHHPHLLQKIMLIFVCTIPVSTFLSHAGCCWMCLTQALVLSVYVLPCRFYMHIFTHTHTHTHTHWSVWLCHFQLKETTLPPPVLSVAWKQNHQVQQRCNNCLE